MLIQKLRLQRGWSQQQLADLSGLSVRTIQRLEQGQVASTESLKSLAAVFEIDFSTLQEPDMNTATAPTTPHAFDAEEALACCFMACACSSASAHLARIGKRKKSKNVWGEKSKLYRRQRACAA